MENATQGVGHPGPPPHDPTQGRQNPQTSGEDNQVAVGYKNYPIVGVAENTKDKTPVQTSEICKDR